jgi:hypothetical protein
MPRYSTNRSASRRCLRPTGVLALACALLAAALTAVLPSPSPAAAGKPPARVIVDGESRLVFRVDLEPHTLVPGPVEGTVGVEVRGFIRRGEPGEPATVSRQFLVALPPAGDYSLSWRVLGTEPLGALRLVPNPFPEAIRDEDLGPVIGERYAIDPAVYDAYRSPATVAADAPVYIRRQRALPVWINPLAYDPVSGEAVLATSIEVEVTFRPDGRARAAAVPESPMWTGVFGRLFVNPGQAAEWRAEPRFEAGAAFLSPGAQVQGTNVKLKVRRTGVHRVEAQTLVGAGFPAGQPITSLHLFRRTYDEDAMTPGVTDVSFTVEEGTGGVAGEFDGADVLVFYALRLRDDPEATDTIEKFSDHNVYWLGTSSGPMMSTRVLTPGFVSADTATASFTATGRFELDLWFREPTPPGNPDFYYQNFGSEAGPIDLALEVGAVPPGGVLSLSAALQGDRYFAPRFIRIRFVNSLGNLILDPAFSVPNKNSVLYQTTVPAASVAPGLNTFRLERPDATRAGVEVLLNYVNVTYPSLYRALDNTLRFHTATLAGDTSITVTGLTDTDVWLLDVTDPDAPVRCTTPPGVFVPAAGGRLALSFRDTIAARKQYAMIPESRMVTVGAADVVLDVPSAIIGGPAEGGVDVLAVSHATFIARMQEWVRLRRAQGYRVLLVDVDDVYDEFTGGVPGARAIDRFVRHFYESGNASALVLVGDSSEDNKRVHATSGPNLVPTHSASDHVASLSEDEIVTTDKRFVKLAGPTGVVDAYPDLIVGRIPVGTDSDMQRVLAKIFAYEKPTASDFWRKRMIIVADDAYSEGASTFGGVPFCFQSNETRFESGQERTARVIEQSLPAGYDVQRIFLGALTGPIHQQNCVARLTAIQYVRDNVTPYLMEQLGQGATLVTIQSHMNRSLVCHEKILSTESSSLLGGPGRDHLRMENRGKPYIIFGMGCHFSDYALHKEQDPGRIINNAPDGDSFAEQLLVANNTGAVATYGSTGFEYLSETNAFMDVMSQVWFYDAPYDTMINQTRGQWVFGELMFLVENRVAGFQTKPVEHYHILGDPLLRIDAGPPAFDVLVDGREFTSGSIVVSGGEGDTIRVSAVVTDENAIHDFRLTIDGADRTGDLTATPLVDPQLPRARQYQLSFAHKLVPATYDIVVRALQAPDTTAGQFHIAAEFTIRVESSVTVAVNGRTVQSGDIVPATGDYRVEIKLPVVIPEDSVSVAVDDEPVLDAGFSHPSPEDSTTWLIRFTRTLSEGTHRLVVRAGTANHFVYDLTVSTEAGLRYVVNYPNPFKDTTSFIYTNDVELSDGRIDVFTVSGRRVRRLEIPPESRQPGRNTVFWDGRDASGGDLANGVYLYVIRVTQRGQDSTIRGKLARIH